MEFITWTTSSCLGNQTRCSVLMLWEGLWLCETLGVPVAPGKTEGPSTKLVFLGIEIDTRSMVLRLPPPKLETPPGDPAMGDLEVLL